MDELERMTRRAKALHDALWYVCGRLERLEEGDKDGPVTMTPWAITQRMVDLLEEVLHLELVAPDLTGRIDQVLKDSRQQRQRSQ